MALVFSVVTGFLGVAVIVWYGLAGDEGRSGGSKGVGGVGAGEKGAAEKGRVVEERGLEEPAEGGKVGALPGEGGGRL